jgi:hypothetical protein
MQIGAISAILVAAGAIVEVIFGVIALLRRRADGIAGSARIAFSSILPGARPCQGSVLVS